MTARPAPPPAAAWLAGAAAPPDDREQILGDLQERFRRRAESRGARAARVWYWGQAVRLTVALVPRRAIRTIPALVAPGTVRAAFRSTLRSPRASLAAMLTLAAGIAAPSAMFALWAGTTSSLPGDRGDRVLLMSLVDHQGRQHLGMPWPLYEVWRESATGPGTALLRVAAFRSSGQVAVGGGDAYASRYPAVYASADLFPLLGVRPVAGRLYTADEDDGLPAVLIREDVWRERFDASPDAFGQVLRVDGVDHVVVGVLPDAFGFPSDHRLWMQPRGAGSGAWSVVGRMAPGASTSVALEQLGAVLGDTPWGEGPNALTVRVETYIHAYWAGQDDTARRVGLVSLILVLVTAINVATLMLARGVYRSRETAVRMAIGAGRGHIMALTLTEVLFLTVGGGALGLGLGRAVLRVMLDWLTSQATIIPYWMDFSLGGRSLVFAALLSLLALVVAGVVPAVRSFRMGLDAILRLQPGTGQGGAGRLMTGIVGLEVALSCFLLCVASAVVDEALLTLDTGTTFSGAAVTTGQFILRPPDYQDEEARRRFLGELSAALRAEPSVRSVAFSSALPGKEGMQDGVAVSGVDDDPAQAPAAQVRIVDPAYFSMFGLRISSGRVFDDGDASDVTPVAMVNVAFARDRGLTGGVLGRSVTVAHGRDGEPYTAMVVGVVDDRGVMPDTRGRPTAAVYLALTQLAPRGTYLLTRTRNGVPLLQVWHETAAHLDPYLPLGEVMSLAETERRGHGGATLYLFVFLGLGTATFLVALVGLYGVHSFLMARRVRDIGVRRALGAQPTQVLRESMLRGLRPVWVGVLLGLAPGFLVARSVVPVRPGIVTYLVAPVALVVASAFALWWPTLKAARADPMDALREG